ncbi:MAG: 3-isopropylmalate dehydratase large subunit [Armatimonadetes bacterium]|nr:3-isopropylmalate dehydratase large subunit [Armatimonadota bacterium]NIM24279.1 3-isopropylmalate dehydratase large subunit [Armatimonadota bacterium]NIM68148.1 3-isopropylmalate dehydratase large subunit [Armatimonadota bacterium]NIM76608.1 3-isopropylmalate dehydratase large subunit [Armatimonadota bacterium]NIN06353.1 3-isopropylmalate dehydratase large subunit [Armatimonadota bacterium]
MPAAQTITQKILAAHCGREFVEPGEFISVQLDLMLANDITAPLALKEFAKIGCERVRFPERVALVPDHFVPAKDVRAAQQAQLLKKFAIEQKIPNYWEIGRGGIEHTLLPEEGLVVSGDCVIGADSHTCTYGALGAFSTGVGSTDFAAALATGECWLQVPESIKFIYRGQLRPWVGGKDLILHTIGEIGVDGALYQAMEFCGEAVSALDIAGRFTMCNMAIEAGGKNGIIAPDEITLAYQKNRAKRSPKVYASDPDAPYARTIEFDCEKIEPQVAFPHLPSNTRPISRVGEVPIDQAVIGSCTNGRIEDLRQAAEILRGRRVHSNVRLIIIPATQEIHLAAVKEGLVQIFLEAGGVFSPPTCGPCLGGHMGILAEGERAIATTNRNFIGRMGHPKSEVYLANPAITAASAVLGRIGSPEEV